MILALLLAAAAPIAPTSALDVERAFAADAQRLGQWTAFRKYAAPDALMFGRKPDLATATCSSVARRFARWEFSTGLMR